MAETQTMTLRDRYIISQALFCAINHFKALEARNDPYPRDGEHAEPSNRKDMERLYHEQFPWYAVRLMAWQTRPAITKATGGEG